MYLIVVKAVQLLHNSPMGNYETKSQNLFSSQNVMVKIHTVWSKYRCVYHPPLNLSESVLLVVPRLTQ